MKCLKFGAHFYTNCLKSWIYRLTTLNVNVRHKTKGVVRPILSHDFGSRSQVDLIDMQSSSHKSQYRWIMVYQCHLTKFCVLHALTSKRAAEVAFQLLDIFLQFGARCIMVLSVYS